MLDKNQNVSEDSLPSKKPPNIDSPPLPLPKREKNSLKIIDKKKKKP